MKHLRSYNEHVRTEMRLAGLPVEPEFEETLIKETTLAELYGSEVPNENEKIWSYINPIEFENEVFSINEMDIGDCYKMIEQSTEFMSPENSEIIEAYRKDIDSIKDDVVVIDSMSNELVDGNHRVMALYLEKIPTVKVVDLSE